MFTIEQIQAAHGKVKSGADFPTYIQEIKLLGVTHYEAYVTDGHTDYHGANAHTATLPAQYAPIQVAAVLDEATFKTELRAHQQGHTDYLTFINMCAATGVEKWKICLTAMTCTYFDKAQNIVLVEKIPE